MTNEVKIVFSEDVKENIKKLAEIADMSKTDLDNLLVKIIHKQKELGVPDEILNDRVERRMQADLKKLLRSRKNENN